ncbi:DUF58 domain-containing protein [Nostocoides australiense]|nr:DUF58 domain-containing protein [Tetrasphaera sp.]
MSQRRHTVPSLGEHVDPVLDAVSPLGWAVLATAVVAWVVGWVGGWIELSYLAGMLTLLFALSCLLTIGRTQLDVRVRVQPTRVRVGEAAAAEVRVRNDGRLPVPAMPLELGIGESAVAVQLPAIRPTESFDDVVILPTGRRGVYPIGPATTLRGDPFGLVRRAVRRTDPVELIVHPHTVYVDGFTSGILRDLEGRTTEDVSSSDLAFHGLREYVPGDDRRHIHWLSTAKRSSAAGQSDLMVRQFLDTRRTSVGVVADCAATSYADPDHFETVLSAAASIAQRAAHDKIELSVAAGSFVLRGPRGNAALDLFARARLGPEQLDAATGRLVQFAPTLSSVALVIGEHADLARVARARTSLAPGVNVHVLRFEPGADVRLQHASGMTLVTFGSLEDLPAALAGRRRA